MSYQALLFCPDQKTARVVSQVLTELDFTVEPCHEPFAAVKKLMAQHFEALVVDCENEQNAALLFKSARNSGINQSSLSVAVVEGQAGVAKAFRIGANLVLTKPIHMEQSKATLRVARGLLRKGQASKPAGAGNPGEVSASLPPMPAPFPAAASSVPPAAGGSAYELDAEPAPAPDPADAALLEYMPDALPPGGESLPGADADSALSRQYAWQPRSNMAEPMASALRRAAEAAGIPKFAGDKASASGPVSHPSIPQARSGAAAAPAPAKDAIRADALFEAPASAASARVTASGPRHSDRADEDLEAESLAPVSDELAVPRFGLEKETSGSGTGKKLVWTAIIVAGIAGGYLGWTKFQAQNAQPTTPAPAQGSVTARPQATLPPVDDAQQTTRGEVTEPSGSTVIDASPTAAKPSPNIPADKPVRELPTPEPGKTAASAGTASVTAKAEASEPLIVKNEPATPKAGSAGNEQAEEAAPALGSIAGGASSQAVASLVNTTAAKPTHVPQQMLRISQGVSEGLLVKRVQPTYPPQARQSRLEGQVELQANVSKAGNITNIKQLSGDAILGRAAIDAVKQWKYKPYYLNGEPIEVQTQITVNFKLP